MITYSASRVYLKLGLKSALADEVPEDGLSCRTPTNVPEADEEDGEGLRAGLGRRRSTRLRSHLFRLRRRCHEYGPRRVREVVARVNLAETRHSTAVYVAIGGCHKWMSSAPLKRVTRCRVSQGGVRGGGGGRRDGRTDHGRTAS